MRPVGPTPARWTENKPQDRVFDPVPHILIESLVDDDQVRRHVARAVEVPVSQSVGPSVQDVTSYPDACFARGLDALELIPVDSFLRLRALRVAGAA